DKDSDTAEIYTLSLHDALPILFQSGSEIAYSQVEHHQRRHHLHFRDGVANVFGDREASVQCGGRGFTLALQEHERHAERCLQVRSEEHTSELQSLAYFVCRLLL